jgi:hypothetical protein
MTPFNLHFPNNKQNKGVLWVYGSEAKTQHILNVCLIWRSPSVLGEIVTENAKVSDATEYGSVKFSGRC